MPPRYAYWTIIAGGLPTAFRAAEREDLLPTFQRIKEKHPDAEMKWFARGKLWESQDAARVRQDAGRGRRPPVEKRGEARPDRHDGRRSTQGRPEQETRGRSWRPGGEHRDPRQKFIDAKKQQNAVLRKERWERKNAPPRAQTRPDPRPPEFQRESRPAGRDNWRDRPRNNPGANPGDWRNRPPADRGAKPQRPWRERPSSDTQGRQSTPDRRPTPHGAKPKSHSWTANADRGKPQPHGRRAEPHGGNSQPRGGKTERHGGKPKPHGWNRNPGFRSQQTEDPRQPPPPRGPDREPRRDDETKPAAPPKPDEPRIPSPGPSERGHIKARRPFRPRPGPLKGPRR